MQDKLILRAHRFHTSDESAIVICAVTRNIAMHSNTSLCREILTLPQFKKTLVYTCPGLQQRVIQCTGANPEHVTNGTLMPDGVTRVWLNPPAHRLPLDLRVPCVYDGYRPIDSGLLRVKLLQVYATYHTAVVTERGAKPCFFCTANDTSELMEACHTDVLFFDRPESTALWRRWTARYGTDAMQLVAPCTCDPDAFLMHASLDRDAAGKALFYRAPAVLPDAPLVGHIGTDYQNIFRCLAVVRLRWIAEHKLLEYALSLSALTGLQLADTLQPRATLLADAMLEHTFMQNCASVPPPQGKPRPEGEAATFTGALVLCEATGLHTGVIVHVDAASLYPNIVREFQLDPLVALLFKELLEARRSEQDPVRARAIKVVTNAVYGSRVHGRYTDAALASKIAEHGREVLQWAVDAVRRAGYTVLSGDTDGLFAQAPKALRHLSPQEHCSGLLDAVNSHWTYIKFKVERVLTQLCIVNRKCWFGQELGDERCERIVVRGLENCKSSSCHFAAQAHAQWQRLVLMRGIVTSSQNEEFISRKITEATHQYRADVLELFSEHPKPNRVHPNVERACITTGHNTTIALREFINASTDVHVADINRILELQLCAPLRRYWTALNIN